MSHSTGNTIGDNAIEYIKIIKTNLGHSAYENMYYLFCSKIKINHYCTTAVLGSKIGFENKKGCMHKKVICLLYRSNQRESEKYINYYSLYYPGNIKESNKRLPEIIVSLRRIKIQKIIKYLMI